MEIKEFQKYSLSLGKFDSPFTCCMDKGIVDTVVIMIWMMDND